MPHFTYVVLYLCNALNALNALKMNCERIFVKIFSLSFFLFLSNALNALNALDLEMHMHFCDQRVERVELLGSGNALEFFLFLSFHVF